MIADFAWLSCDVERSVRHAESETEPAMTKQEANQQRSLDDGSTHEVLKNFPTREQAFALLVPRAHGATWTEHPHYWVLEYQLG